MDIWLCKLWFIKSNSRRAELILLANIPWWAPSLMDDHQFPAEEFTIINGQSWSQHPSKFTFCKGIYSIYTLLLKKATTCLVLLVPTDITVNSLNKSFWLLIYSHKTTALHLSTWKAMCLHNIWFIIDREAREIMYLVASVRLSVRLSPLSRLNQSKVFVCVSVIS